MYKPDKHHRRSIRLKGYDYSSPSAYFITICTHQRECLFGEIVDGEMRLNQLGQLVRSHWLKLPRHHTHVELDGWVVMPNHIHGILIFNNPRISAAGGRGAALGQDVEDTTDISNPNATPSYDRTHANDDSNPNATPPCDRTHADFDGLPAEPGVAFGRESLSSPSDGLPNAAPLPPDVAFGREPLSSPLDGLPNAGPGVAFGREPLSSPLDGLPNAAPLPPRLVGGTVGAVVLNFKSITTRSWNRIKRSPGSSLWQRNYYEHIIRDEESVNRIRQYIQDNPLVWQEDQLHPDNPSKW